MAGPFPTPSQHPEPDREIVAVYGDRLRAGRAVVDLRNAGLPAGAIVQDRRGERAIVAEAEMAEEANRGVPVVPLAFATRGMTRGWVAGTVAGTAAGALLGVLVGIFFGAMGILLGSLAGAGAGATAGFILGGSFGAIAEDQGQGMAAEDDTGGTLNAETGFVVGFRASGDEELQAARAILERHHPRHLTVHR